MPFVLYSVCDVYLKFDTHLLTSLSPTSTFLPGARIYLASYVRRSIKSQMYVLIIQNMELNTF